VVIVKRYIARCADCGLLPYSQVIRRSLKSDGVTLVSWDWEVISPDEFSSVTQTADEETEATQ
jgi:hypothetical protein